MLELEELLLELELEELLLELELTASPANLKSLYHANAPSSATSSILFI